MSIPPRNSSKTDATQNLARISARDARAFLEWLANLRGSQAAKKFRRQYVDWLPQWEFDAESPEEAALRQLRQQKGQILTPEQEEAKGRARRAIGLYGVAGLALANLPLEAIEIPRLLRWGDCVRALWQQTNRKVREYGIFLVIQRLLAQEYGPRWTDARILPDSLPPETRFEQALWYLAREGGRARRCRNDDCLSPYFFAQRSSQIYCSAPCAAPAQKEAKLKWWNERGKAWRKKLRKRRGKHAQAKKA